MNQQIENFCRSHRLTSKETQVMGHLIGGQDTSAAYLAENLQVSPNTIRIHLRNINFKLGTHSKAQTLQKFIQSLTP
ncbi:helix-turn-helix transcriptional regulator [Pseudobacteriovorax antillogorgiicola]|uniref:DNA-binding transcriptional regulator, CsgD family n=1 Tax=Pseudobacteriovorax antillogorgiicola TaxID=1513793 RepID=A0A1Y6BUL7_9BACT|nr:LuxR C-terminal-related transcriptional regulator [Pseudobacteriovorax antillogorgiicola]TCS53058.1 DNA-binding CsgD family transcriptional regulator [Pseudobacteriovorax antillogorgiicola]SMF26343.1 DNA-binding transcriptional regulator, CsgD family [Pseudobacteriovorax antillogorgiicola]